MTRTLVPNDQAEQFAPHCQEAGLGCLGHRTTRAEQFAKHCQDAGGKAKLVVREGKAHGGPGIEKDLPLFAEWFDEHLGGMKPAASDSQPRGGGE